MKSLEHQIFEEHAGLLRKAGIAPEKYPVLFVRQDDGRCHVEVGSNERLELVVTDRGSVISRARSQDRNEVLYELMKRATFAEAQEFEREHRIKGQDTRRQLFDRQITLMGRVESSWRQRLSWEIAEMLVRAPFRDERTINGTRSSNPD